MTGLYAWLMQRFSAVYLGVLLPVALVYLLLSPPADYQVWRATLSCPWIASILFVGVLMLLIHAWVGLRNMVLDYVKPVALRLVVLLLIGLYLALSGFWLTVSLIKVLA